MKICNEIIKDLKENPDDWVSRSCFDVFENDKKGISIKELGLFHYTLNAPKAYGCGLGIFESLRLKKAFKAWAKDRVLKRLKERK